jgi:hypothetical protein
MTDKEKFYHELLISLHTLRWTGSPKLVKLLDIIGRYSYKHTNSNAGDEYEPEKYFNQLKEDYNKLFEI